MNTPEKNQTGASDEGASCDAREWLRFNEVIVLYDQHDPKVNTVWLE